MEGNMSDENVMKAIAAMAAQLTVLTETAGSIDTRLERVEHRLEGVGQRLDSLEARVDGMHERFDQLEDRVQSLERRVEAGFNYIDGRYDGLIKVFSDNWRDHDRRLTDLERKPRGSSR
jgi:predicted nuclease with TOPRIM domain